MQTNLVGGRFAQNGAQDWRNPLFGVFGPFLAPGGGKISLSPPNPQKPANGELPEKFLNTTQRRQNREGAQCERGSDEPKSSPKLPGGAELRPKKQLYWRGGGIHAHLPRAKT